MGNRVGMALAKELIAHARGLGYTAMYLDTVPDAMRSANAFTRGWVSSQSIAITLTRFWVESGSCGGVLPAGSGHLNTHIDPQMACYRAAGSNSPSSSPAFQLISGAQQPEP